MYNTICSGQHSPHVQDDSLYVTQTCTVVGVTHTVRRMDSLPYSSSGAHSTDMYCEVVAMRILSTPVCSVAC